MAGTKFKGVVAVAAVLSVAAGGFLLVKGIPYFREKWVWRRITAIDARQLKAAAPIVSIRPAKFGPAVASAWVGAGGKQFGSAKSVLTLLQDAYHVKAARILAPEEMPSGRYDFIVSLPDHQSEALQAAIREKFGLVGRKETRETNVFILKQTRLDGPGLKTAAKSNTGDNLRTGTGHIKISNGPMSTLTFALERYLKTAVLDETDLSGRYDIDLGWSENPQDLDAKAMKAALWDALGMELVPTNQTIEVLVVEKIK